MYKSFFNRKVRKDLRNPNSYRDAKLCVGRNDVET